MLPILSPPHHGSANQAKAPFNTLGVMLFCGVASRRISRRLARLDLLKKEMTRAMDRIRDDMVPNPDRRELMRLNKASIALIDRVRARLAADLKKTATNT